jgi:ElaB/YqjD/DUF883 family membrane-anchored ribosome-binding protein
MTEATTQKLLDELRAVVADAEALIGATAGDLGERTQAARAQVADSVAKAQAGIQDLESQLEERTKILVADATRYVRENPWQSVGIAAAVGVVLGVILGRR